jgi:hypothetical protein
MPNEPAEKVTLLRIASFAGSKIGNYFLPSKVVGSANQVWSRLLEELW